MVLHCGFRCYSDIEGNSTKKWIYALSFLVGKHCEPRSIEAKLFLPIIPIGIVAYAFIITLLWGNLGRNSCNLLEQKHEHCWWSCYKNISYLERARHLSVDTGYILSQLSQSSAKAKPKQIIVNLKYSKLFLSHWLKTAILVHRTKDHMRKHFWRERAKCIRTSRLGMTVPGQRSWSRAKSCRLSIFIFAIFSQFRSIR